MTNGIALAGAVSAALVTAGLVGSLATANALFLTSLHPDQLPAIFILTGLSFLGFMGIRGGVAPWSPPTAFLASALLFYAEWLVRPMAPTAVAVAVFVHVAVLVPFAVSNVQRGFQERLRGTPVRPLAAASALGAIGGALLSDRVAVNFGTPAMLLAVSLLQMCTALLVRSVVGPRAHDDSEPRLVGANPRGRSLMTLTLAGTTSAVLLDYLFKAGAVEALGSGDVLLRFFAAYYGVTTCVSLALDALARRQGSWKPGLEVTLTSPSIALLAGTLGGVVTPGFGSVVVARAGESVFRSSWFREARDVLTSRLSPHDRKPLARLEVFEHLGTVGGGLALHLAILFPPATESVFILGGAVVGSVIAVWTSIRLAAAVAAAPNPPASGSFDVPRQIPRRAHTSATTTLFRA